MAYVASHSTGGYVRPRLTPSGTGDLILKQARHPCLEIQVLPHQSIIQTIILQ